LEEAKELHKPIIRKFKRRKVIVHNIDDIWSADLVDMRQYEKQNKGFKYLLTVIDVFSKFAWAIPLKVKTGKQMIDLLKKENLKCYGLMPERNSSIKILRNS